MTLPIIWGSFRPYWTAYHKVTFDGVNRLIIINPNETSLDVETDIYSDWKEWSLIYENLKFAPALRTTGGDQLPGGRRVGQYFFLINGWKLVPPTDNLLSDIEIVGNLFADDGSDILRTDNVRLLRQVVSQFTEIASPTVDAGDIQVIVTGSGLTSTESAQLTQLVGLNTIQTQSLNTLLASSSIQGVTLENISTSQTQISSSVNTINSIVTGTDIAVDAVLVSQSIHYTQLLEMSASLVQQTLFLQEQSASLVVQSASLAQIQANTEDILSAGGNLTPEQSTMLMEMYRLLGLDPTRPLVVSPTARDAGAEISQTIGKVGDTVTVTRQ